MRVYKVAACAFVLLGAGTAHADVTFSFTAGPGLLSLAGSDPVKATKILSGATTAATKWGGLFSDTVTLKYTLDYDPGLPALGAAFDVYSPTPYAGPSSVKSALFAKALSPFDMTANMHVQAGPALAIWQNDIFAGPSFPPTLDVDGSVNNSVIDISRSHLKGLGLLPALDGPPGADGTIKIGSADFDFDPTDGIDATKYDFVGVMMHEMAHGMGFVSGVDAISGFLPSPFSPPGPIHGTAIVTVLDLFRYSTDSVTAGLFVPDVSLPVPPTMGFSDVRYFSIDGGSTIMELFSTGTALAGDMHQAGHWKSDPTFGLMDPTLALGFDLTAAFEASLTIGPLPMDLVAMDVIGWNVIPEPASGMLLLLAGAMVVGRRTRSRV